MPVRRIRTMPAPLAGIGLGAVALVVLLIGALLIGHFPLPFDRSILVGFRMWGGPRWLGQSAVDVTALGSGTILTLVVVVTAGWLLVQRLWLTAAAAIAACWSGGEVVGIAKHLVGRLRPDLVPHLVPVSNASFPSGHAANSAVVYLTLAALATQVVRDRAAQRYLVGAAVLLVGAIGISRVFLGVHWPSDVMAGWCFGTLWALAWWRGTAGVRTAIGGER